MTDETEESNVHHFKLVTNNIPSPEHDQELQSVLQEGAGLLQETINAGIVSTFFVVVLEKNSDVPLVIGAGETQPLKLIGALRYAEDFIIQDSLSMGQE